MNNKINLYLGVAKYIQEFLFLKINENKGQIAPHKPLLLLSIIKLIDEGEITDNKIPPIQKIKQTYECLWDRYIPVDCIYSKAVWTPYWHLYNEPFWHFKPIVSKVSVDLLIEESRGQTASIGKIRDVIDYAYFDEELYTILQKDNLRHLFKQLLIDTYL